MSKLFISAVNVHVGGGRELLLALLRSEQVRTGDVVLLSDARMPLPADLPATLVVHRFAPTIRERLKAETWLRANVSAQDYVLCFGNLPPLLKLDGNVVVFVQNRYLINDSSLVGFPVKTRLRLLAERLWWKKKARHADAFVVQTPSMQSALAAALVRSHADLSDKVAVVPFVESAGGYARSISPTELVQRKHDSTFVYVASGEPHKNHLNLIEAWRLLSLEGLFPRLILTVDESRHETLARRIHELRNQYQLVLDNQGTLSRQEVGRLYNKVDALINPSVFESFGLPLIEARQAGLPVLAPELDYVRDVLDPEETFDAASPRSIASAVKRFIGITNPPLRLVDGTGFLATVFAKTVNKK